MGHVHLVEGTWKSGSGLVGKGFGFSYFWQDTLAARALLLLLAYPSRRELLFAVILFEYSAVEEEINNNFGKYTEICVCIRASSAAAGQMRGKESGGLCCTHKMHIKIEISAK